MFSILHLNQSSLSGGAAIAGLRLHEGLRTEGIASRMLVSHGNDDVQGISVIRRRFSRLENAVGKLTNAVGINYINNINTAFLKNHPWMCSADVIHLHNLHGGYCNYLLLPMAIKGRPTVLTLHDMWPFTGHCAHSFDCNRWQSGCGKCPYPDMFPPIRHDGTAFEWKLKKRLWRKLNLHVHCPSRWLYELAKRSFLASTELYYIPHGIDTEVFKPLDPEYSRWALGLSTHQYVIMASAQSFLDKWKGMDLLLYALHALPSSLLKETVMLLMGRHGLRFMNEFPCRVLPLDYIYQDRFKVLAYSAADVFVHPARAETFGLVIQESLACATPVVAFHVGGISDLVDHGVTGYLSNPFDIGNFSFNIRVLLEDKSSRLVIGRKARQFIIDKFSLQRQVIQHIKIYEQMLRRV